MIPEQILTKNFLPQSIIIIAINNSMSLEQEKTILTHSQSIKMVSTKNLIQNFSQEKETARTTSTTTTATII